MFLGIGNNIRLGTNVLLEGKEKELLSTTDVNICGCLAIWHGRLRTVQLELIS